MKLIVAACNSATAAALPDLQRQLSVPVIGVLAPEAHAAVLATRNRRIGLLATEATVASGRYAELVRALDAGAEVVLRRVPAARPADRGRRRRSARRSTAAVREYAAPLKEADVDTVILGCTHYPLIRPIFQRVFGRGVTLVFSAEETAREAAETLARKGIENDDRARGHVPLPHDRRPRAVPRDGAAVPPAPDRRRPSTSRSRRSRRSREARRPAGRPSSASSTSTPDYLEQPHGSVLYAQGKTIVLCTATVEEGVPRWLYKSGRGWMTAEYAMLPASTGERTQRAVSRGRPDGRTVEIQRLIGRALRSVCDFEALGERTLWLDCDVLQADGGTRCASITGAWIAARRALDRFGLSKALTGSIAAVSVGIVDGEAVLDLDYEEDSSAETDMNVVMTGDGRLVEVQATAERDPFSRELLDSLLDLAAGGIDELTAAQARSRVGARRREAAPRLAQREQAARAAGRASRPGRSRSSTCADEPVEDGATFLDNARIKARHGRRACAGRRLGRRRGLGHRGRRARRAARASSPLAGPPTASRGCSPSSTARADRRARYVCELVVARSRRRRAPRDRDARGRDRATSRRGDEGFGYDPIFVPLGETRTVAELGNAWKAEHSHRARAARALAQALASAERW